MKSERLEKWLKNIYNTEEQEISCSQCFESVSRYVELELSGANPALSMPEVRQHLDQCAACREEYETLRDLSRLENEGGPPAPDDLLPPG